MNRRETVLITGASAGIGLALARRLADRFDMVLTGRRERPADLPPEATYLRTDMRDPGRAVDQIEEALRTAGIKRLDRLVINAATGFYRPADAEEPDQIRATLDINLVTAVLLARRLAPLLEAARGKLVLIGSVAHRGSPNMPSYAASKAGLTGLARSLEAEWRGTIAVQILHPGPTSTGMHERAGYRPGRLGQLFFSADGMALAIDRLMQTRRRSATIGAVERLRQLFWRQRS